MSKRESAEVMKDGYSIFVGDMQPLGYIPEGILNWVALMGWSYDDRTEFFNLPDLVEKFSLDHLNPSPAAINFSKLDHFNGLHIRSLPIPELARRVKPFFEAEGLAVDDARLLAVTPLIQERMVTLDDGPVYAAFFFQEEVNPAAQDLVGKDMSPAASIQALQQAGKLLATLPTLTKEAAEEPMRQLAEQLGLSAGQLFGILRMAVTGQKISPPLFESMEVIGREKVLARLRRAAELLATLPLQD
jgi:glutamyl-tRNA synthetase